MKVFIILFSIIFFSNAKALENLEFATKNPYPVCIQEVQDELKKINLELPASYFSEKKSTTKPSDQATPCADLISLESKEGGLSALQKFYTESFPKMDQELFAQKFVQQKNHIEILNKINSILINCQNRTEELHVLAAKASSDIYDETVDTDKIPEGYILKNKATDFFEFPDSDVKGYLVFPKVPNSKNLPPIIAFAGTRSTKSGFSDLTYGSRQVSNAKVKFLQWLKAIEKNGNKEVIITGHSLGGGLAQTLAAMIPDPNNLKTHVVTFNGFGGVDAAKAYNSIYMDFDEHRDFKKFQATRDAVGYRMEGDVVSLFGKRFGETRTIPSNHIALRIIKNHKMGTIFEQMASNPHALMNAKKEDVGPSIRPISFIIDSASSVVGIGKVAATVSEMIFTKQCIGPYNYENKKSNKCEIPNGDAITCLKNGLQFKKDSSQLKNALDNFRIGCDLCHLESCREFAVINKRLGYPFKSTAMSMKACILGDAESCIESGYNTLQFKDEDNSFVFLGCAAGEKELCKNVANPQFSAQYFNLMSDVCSGTTSYDNCELLYYGDNSSTILTDEKINRIEKLLKKKGVSVDAKNKYGATPLHLAINRGKLELVKLFIEKGASLTAQTQSGKTPLLLAIENGNIEVVKFLLSKGASLSVADKDGRTPLHYAIWKGNLEMTKFLLSKNVSISSVDKEGVNLALYAAHFGNLEILKLLVERGANPLQVDKVGNSPLLMASARGDFESVKYLIAKGANPLAANTLGQTPLQYAANSGNIKLFKFFESQYPASAITDTTAGGVLLFAAKSGNTELVKYLLDKGASVSAKDQNGYSPIFHAVHDGNQELVEMLVKKGANISEVQKDRVTPLFYAVSGGKKDVLKYLLEKGADPLYKDKLGNTPFISAAQNGNFEMIKLCVERGVSIDVTNDLGASPLLAAAYSGNLDIVKYLLEKGANPSASTKDGVTLLGYAANSGNMKLVKYLVEERKIEIPSKILVSPSIEIRQYLNENREKMFDVVNSGE